MALSDFPYSYGTQPVYDPISDTVQENATGGVLVGPDGNQVAIGDLNGNPITEITSNPSGMSTQFRSSVPYGQVKFGELYVTVWSNEIAQYAINAQSAIDTANSALVLAQQALDAAVAGAGTGGSGGGGLPANVTLEDIPNGATRLAMTFAERQKLATVAANATALTIGPLATQAKAGNYAPTAVDLGAVRAVGGNWIFWGGRTTTQGPPSVAEGAVPGVTYAFLDVV